MTCTGCGSENFGSNGLTCTRPGCGSAAAGSRPSAPPASAAAPPSPRSAPARCCCPARSPAVKVGVGCSQSAHTAPESWNHRSVRWNRCCCHAALHREQDSYTHAVRTRKQHLNAGGRASACDSLLMGCRSHTVCYGHAGCVETTGELKFIQNCGAAHLQALRREVVGLQRVQRRPDAQRRPVGGRDGRLRGLTLSLASCTWVQQSGSPSSLSRCAGRRCL